MDTVTWQMVALAAISALSGIIAAIGALVSAIRSSQNKTAIKEVHGLVNSRLEEIKAKLESALQTISDLTGQRKKSVDEADTK